MINEIKHSSEQKYHLHDTQTFKTLPNTVKVKTYFKLTGLVHLFTGSINKRAYRKFKM